MLKILILFSLFVVYRGFLLDDKDPQQTTGQLQSSNQYLSISKYLDEKTTQLSHEIEKFRNDQQYTMNLLTSQLKHKLRNLENQISSQQSENQTCHELEQRYAEQEKNITKLFEQFLLLQKENREQKLELITLQNKTASLERNLESLKQLKHINQLQSLKALQGNIQRLDSSVTILMSKEQARSQDFLALYSMIKKKENETTGLIGKLKDDVAYEHKKVGLTGCFPSSPTLSSSTILKFSKIISSENIPDVSTYKSTGEVTCHISGMYFVSVTILTKTQYSSFYICINDKAVHYGYVSDDVVYQSGTSVAVLLLQAGDKISVKTGNQMLVDHQYSCFTIFKI